MKRRRVITLSVIGVILLGAILMSPGRPFSDVPYSTVVTDCEGELLGARTAADGQWRFPPSENVPERFEKALLQFEDKHFYHHPGVNPVSMVRALVGNIRAGKVTSGGSTITMQVIRLSRGRERTVKQKIIESVQAVLLEIRYSKKKILSLYASHAPFGGNVVGLEAASWRYFGRPSDELSWAEAATLAVLPNAPSEIHPGKNRDLLLQKRNSLLRELHEKGYFSDETLSLSLEEPLPDAPLPLPSYASHIVAKAPEGVVTRTGIRINLQKQIEQIVGRYSDDFATRGINDLAAIVIDNATGETIAYCGNSSPGRIRPGMQVDIADSPRSTGSILKPFLFSAAMQEGIILPYTLIKDVPVNMDGFSPQNFDQQFYGAVPASEALSRSLNVPAVHLLRAYGVPKFHSLLKDCGLSTLRKDPSWYGLSLILGGGEGKLTEITRAYSGMVRSYIMDEKFPLSDKVSLWYTFEALKDVNRPDELDWRYIPSLRKAAWKTGTSYGFRDAWAVGMTPEYTVGVWAGNAGGQGVPGLTGASVSGPVMFAILNTLPSGEWFREPSEGIFAEICPLSGHLRSPECPEGKEIRLPSAAMESEPCPYHNGGSFALPPAMEWFYKKYHPEYEVPKASPRRMEFIYPESGSELTIPRQMDGSEGKIVFELAHRDPSATVWWHLDEEYVGETRFVHNLSLTPSPGRHTLVAVDASGHTAAVSFVVKTGGRF